MKTQTSELIPLNVRLPRSTRQELDSEVQRQARRQEFVVSCFLSHCLRLPVAKRDAICAAKPNGKTNGKRGAR